MRTARREEGSMLLFVTLLALVSASLTAAVMSVELTRHRASSEGFELELARQTADSGVAYYLGQFLLNPDYFDFNSAPLEANKLGIGTFALESAEPIGGEQWQVVVNGGYGRMSFRMAAVVGYRQVQFPGGLVVSGTGNPTDVVVDLNGKSTVASYDSDSGPFDINDPGTNAGISVDGSVDVSGSSQVYGDITATGQVSNDGSAGVTGTVIENSVAPPIEDFDSIVKDLEDASRTTNDNGLLAGIFGSQWTPIDGSENYGDLIVSGGTYVIPSGTFRVRSFVIEDGATLTFDTQQGPTTLVYIGSGPDTGNENKLLVSGNSQVYVKPGSTSNALTTILAADADFRVNANSVYGQDFYHFGSDDAGYSQIISMGGDGNSDTIEAGAQSKVYGRLYAKSHTLDLGGNSSWYGSATVQSISLRGSTSGPSVFAIDEGSTGMTLSDPTNFEVLATWPAVSGD